MMVEFGGNDGTIGTCEEGMGSSSYRLERENVEKKIMSLARENLRDFYFLVSE